jgi:hypothetical protein
MEAEGTPHLEDIADLPPTAVSAPTTAAEDEARAEATFGPASV